MIDLWALLVENIFGSFYVAILGLAAIFLIILILGGVSFLTALWYDGIFLVVMNLGYGTRIIPALVFIALFLWFALQIKGYIERSGGNY